MGIKESVLCMKKFLPKHEFFLVIIIDTFKMIVDYGKTYLLRIINAVMDEELFFAIENHKLTVVGR